MLFITVIFLVAGIALAYFGRKFELEAKRAAAWPVVAGELEQCQVLEVPGTKIDDFSSWKLRIRYSYVVSGTKYHSDRYAFGYGDGRDSQIHRVVADSLRAQSPLLVHYDPVRPSEAVLNTEVQKNATKLGHACLVMAIISAFIWVLV